MKYIVFKKCNNKICSITEKEPVSVSRNLAVAQCDKIPNGNSFVLTNLKLNKKTVEVKTIETDENGNETKSTKTVVKEYYTCELVANNKQNQANEIRNEIQSLKAKLKNTDYIANKLAEELAYGDLTAVEEIKTAYAEELENRKSWRARINELEKEYENVI